MEAIFGIPEIAIYLFQYCHGFQDAIALASTCRALASIWRAHLPSVLWPLARAEIPGFSQALVAVSPSSNSEAGPRSMTVTDIRN